jgi:hypothetical protein
MRWEGHPARMGMKRSTYRVLVRNPEWNRPLGKPRRRLENNNTMDFREIGWGDMDWIQLAQDRDHWKALVNTAMNLQVP